VEKTYPLGYTLSCDFFLSPNTQMALSALHRLQGLAPSHFDFFNRQRSQALQTRFRMLSWASIELDLCEDMIGWEESASRLKDGMVVPDNCELVSAQYPSTCRVTRIAES
jgi:hypothetical protein